MLRLSYRIAAQPEQQPGAVWIGPQGGLVSGKLRLSLFASAMAIFMAVPAHAYDNYTVGHMSRVSYSSDFIIITVDSALPTNCAGTFSGWMAIPVANKAMQAFVTGLWMRGDAAQKSLAIYTTGIGSTGFCEISQIDTQSAG